MPVGFKERPEGSVSKLRTYRDGFRILRMIAACSTTSGRWRLYGVLLRRSVPHRRGSRPPLVIEYAKTGLVPRFPTAFLAASFLMLLSVLMLIIGILLDGLRKVRQEKTRIAYMAQPAPPTEVLECRCPCPHLASSRFRFAALCLGGFVLMQVVFFALLVAGAAVPDSRSSTSSPRM